MNNNNVARWPDTRDLPASQAALRVATLAVLVAVGWLAVFAVLGLFVAVVAGFGSAVTAVVVVGLLWMAWTIGSR